MEMNFEADIVYLIEVDQEDNALIQQVGNSSSDNWLQNAPNSSSAGSTVYLNIDSYISEEAKISEITDVSKTLKKNKQQFEYIPSKRKSIPPNILRPNKKKSVKATDCSSVGKSILIKNDILKTRAPKVLQMKFVNDIAHITFKDELDHQIFLTQQLKLPDASSKPERTQQILKVCSIPVCSELDFTLPQIITNASSKIYLCPLHCNKAFLHIADAKLHTLKHMQVKPYKCNVPNCPWEFYTYCKLARHKETHLQTRKFICDIENCKRAFSTIYNLNEHKRKHNQPATLPCLVSDCNSFFQNDKQRRIHYKSHEPSEAPFHCHNGNCTRSFFIKAVLDSHLRSCVQRESKIICKYPNCGKEFSSPYRLREHIRQHTGAKPYQCTYENCSRSFATASKLKRHQSVHTGDRKFHCTIGDCTKSFLRSEHLKDHTLTHIEKKATEIDAGKPGPALWRKQAAEQKMECTKFLQEDETSSNSHNADVLLEQAIQSLGVPSDMILGTGLLPDEPLTLLGNENFSTVNLRDLD